MNFSVGDLCKKSACQLYYLRSHPEKVIVTPEQLSGIKKQANKSESKYREMCGSYNLGTNKLYFSWDEVRIKSGGVLQFIEHKQVLSTPEEWYLNNSLLQTAIYATLSVRTRKFETAKFYQKQGNPCLKLDTLGASRRFYLYFGSKGYRVRLENSEKLVQFIKEKAQASMNYNNASAWDKKWKHKEFLLLQNCFKITNWDVSS
jgi:hypothetical protein